MSTKILLKRGTYSAIESAILDSGEPAFALDTHELIISDGNNKIIIGSVIFDTIANRPNFGKPGKLFFATDTKELYLDTGSNWVIASGNDGFISTMDDITDGTNYVKTENNFSDTDISDLNDAKTHITSDGTDHTYINQDLRNTATPSFQQILIQNSPSNGNNVATKDYVDTVIKSIDWQDSVLSISENDPSTLTPNVNDRYVIPAGSSGDWSSHVNSIAIWNGSQWEYIAPNNGLSVYVEDDGNFRLWNGTAWITFGTVVNHDVLSGLSGLGPEYYHLNQNQYNEATRYANDTQSGLIDSTTYNKIPTSDEKDALIGTDGTPSSNNKFVTDSDSRLSNSRPPTTHASTHQHGGSDEIGTSTPTANAIPKANASGNLNNWITIIDGGII